MILISGFRLWSLPLSSLNIMNRGYFSQLMSSNGPCTSESSVSRYKCLTKYLIFLQPQAFCDAQYTPNSFSAGARPRTPLGELTTLVGSPPPIRRLDLSAFGASRISFSESWQPYGGSGGSMNRGPELLRAPSSISIFLYHRNVCPLNRHTYHEIHKRIKLSYGNVQPRAGSMRHTQVLGLKHLTVVWCPLSKEPLRISA